MTDELTLDPSITAEELQRAHDEPAAAFPDIDLQDSTEDLDFLVTIPATPHQALAKAKGYTDNDTFVGIGLCQRTVRTFFNIGALWPDAQTSWENSAPRHKTSDPEAIPRGAVIYWSNGGHGHVALSCGGGICRTTDYRRNGFVDLAPIANLASWCSGRLDGWGEVLNGFDVWPDHTKPPPPPWGLVERERMLANSLRRAKQRHATQRRIDGLQTWHDKVAAHLKTANRKHAK